MTPSDIIGILAIVIVPVGGVFSLIRYFAMRDRKSIDVEQKATKEEADSQKRRFEADIEALKKELYMAQRDLDVLKEKVSNLPSKDLLQARFEAMEERLDRRFEALGQRIEAMTAKLADGLRCPHATPPPACKV